MKSLETIMVSQQPEDQLNHNGISAVTQSISPKPTVVRKKFAKPPVKVACLACRASRTRCDGQDPCLNCRSKKKKCSYLPSKRGGPRKKNKPAAPTEIAVQEYDILNPVITPVSPGFDDAMFSEIDVLSAPAAGIRNLDFSLDVPSMFAGLFVPNAGGNAHEIELTPPSSSISSQSMVRTYDSEHDILNAYYDFVHDYFPILPPRVTPAAVDRPLKGVGSYAESPSEEPILLYRPRSPLSLAISAVLALIPHPCDLEPTSPSSIQQRRTYAHTFAQMATASVESDCEIQASSTNPSEALSGDHQLFNRKPFHPHTPVELERLLALLVLSVYEYTQRGNLLKMSYRAGQALSIARGMSLHSLGQEYDEFAEARRRAWWMTYYCVLQSSIVSTTPLSIDANDPHYVTPYPRFSGDPDVWSILLQCQQLLVSATQFVIDLRKSISTRSNFPCIYGRMQQLDSWANAILAQSKLPRWSSGPVDGSSVEYTTAQSVRAISHIKLSSAQIKVHRFRAFSDIPIFIKRHCDLTTTISVNSVSGGGNKDPETPNGISSVGCCSSLDQLPQSSREYVSSSTSSTSTELQPLAQYSFINGFPFTAQHSAGVCLSASLMISRMFQSLPLPQPLSDPDSPPQVLQLLPQNRYPRTMPSFACCLMQGSYALFMMFWKTSVENHALPEFGTGETNHSCDEFIEELRQGLEGIITTASNYAIASEALNGMRDDIKTAYHTAFLQE
ncbi:C6 zinc finger domain protein [Aspergillus egyptiacus]|nr:C6 zinc finger domain protein [Aspergillus egyptiacus]